MRNKVLFYLLSLVIYSILFFVFIVKFDFLSHTIFKDRVFGENFYSVYYELLLGFITFLLLIPLSIIISLIANRKEYIILWIIKGGLITLFFMIFYETKYGGDPAYYADEALKNNFSTPFGINGTLNIVYINHLFTFVVGKSYYSLKVLNSFIGFLGLFFLYSTYEYILKKSNLQINNKFIYIFFLFPSIIFWSSFLNKDPLNLFLVGIFIYSFIHIIDKFNIFYFFMIVISIWLVYYIRSWWSVIMLTSIFLYYIKMNSIRNFLIFLIVFPIFVILIQKFLQSEGIYSFDILFFKMTQTTKYLAYGNSAITVHTIKNIWDYFIYYIPNLFTALFRPMIWDIRNAFTLIASIENVILLYLTYKYIIKNWREIYNNKYLKFLLLFIFSWSLLYVIISPANLGGAARFKLQVLPSMLILIGVAITYNQRYNLNNNHHLEGLL